MCHSEGKCPQIRFNVIDTGIGMEQESDRHSGGGYDDYQGKEVVEERGPTFPRGSGGVVERLHGLNKLRHGLCRDLRIFAKGFRPERVGFPADGRGIVGKTVHRIVFRPASRPNPRPDRSFLEKVHAYLDERRPLGTELYVIGCEYVPLGISVGVALAEGTGIDATTVVVCGGAIHSPAILLRSGIDRAGVGRGLQDHPSFPLALRLHEEVVDAQSRVAVSALLRATHLEHHDLQLLAMDVLDPALPSLALLMGAVMRVHSRGSVRLAAADPTVDPIVEFAMLSDERDLVALRAAATLTERVALSSAMRAVAAPEAYDLSDQGLRSAVGDYVHAVGTCRMGVADDPHAVVDARCRVVGYDGLLVCDASVMPTVPRANTHLPTVMIAERVAAMFDAAG